MSLFVVVAPSIKGLSMEWNYGKKLPLIVKWIMEYRFDENMYQCKVHLRRWKKSE
jgi:hypothetical protein